MDQPKDTCADETQGAAADTFDLHITFTGLCLLVDDLDRKDGKKLLHALMPRTGGDVHTWPGNVPEDACEGHEDAANEDEDHIPPPGYVHKHLSRLLYDLEYEKADAATKEPATEKNKKDARHIEMDNRSLDFRHLDTDAVFTATLDREMKDYSVFHLSEFVISGSENTVFGRVPRQWLDDAETGGMVVTRVTLEKGGVVGGDKGVQWKIGGRDAKNMAVALEWKIPNVVGRFLELSFKGLNGNKPHTCRDLTLYPIGGRIHLWFLHGPETQIPPEVPVVRDSDDPAHKVAHHFHAFYSLLATPVPVFQKPEAKEESAGHHGDTAGGEASASTAKSFAAASGGSDASCIQPRATAIPLK